MPFSDFPRKPKNNENAAEVESEEGRGQKEHFFLEQRSQEFSQHKPKQDYCDPA